MAMKMANLALEAGNMPQEADAAGAHPGPMTGTGSESGPGEGSPQYPPGMQMQMGHEELQKMGHHEKPPTHGSKVHFEGHGHVTESGTHPDGTHHATVQVSHMGMEHDGPKKSIAERMYGEPKGTESKSEERKEAK
jgi:hypothetical protein